MAEAEQNFQDGSEALDRVDELLSDIKDEPKSLEEYTNEIYEDPSHSGHKQRAHYLLDAIKSKGKREVREKGELKERWKFFDDPWNDGEHAIIGNTDMLNSWVNDLENRVRPDGAGVDKIDWFEGATATGKSEFRKNIIAGLNSFSKTEEGRIHTIEWNFEAGGSPNKSFDGTGSGNYIDAPGVEPPLNLYPEDIQKAIEEDINSLVDEEIVLGDGSLLPPSLQEREGHWDKARNTQNFSKKFDEEYVRIKNIVLGEGPEGKGIRTINAEESDKNIQHLLLGKWMLNWTQNDIWPKREYDGLTAFNFIEEGQQFISKIPDLKNFIDNNKVSGAVDIHMDNYTMILSNEIDLDITFQKRPDVDQDSIQRRTNRYKFDYLTNFRQETGLLRKELSPRNLDFNPAIADEIEETRKPLDKKIVSEEEEKEIEYAPHTLESASMYAIISRLTDDLPEISDEDDKLSYIEKAKLFEAGEVTRTDSDNGRDTIEFDELEFEDLDEEGKEGIPVTHVRDSLAEVSYEESKGKAQEYDLDLGKVVTPVEAIDLVEDELSDNPLLDDKVDEYGKGSDRFEEIREHAYDKMEEDVLDAIFMDLNPDEKNTRVYLDHLYAWKNDEKVVSEDTGREMDHDGYTLKEFETKYLGFDPDENYDGAKAKAEVTSDRRDLIESITKGVWENREKDMDFKEKVKEKPLEFEPIRNKLSIDQRDWDDISEIADGTRYGEFEAEKWDEEWEPLTFEHKDYGTDTAQVKYKALSNMVEEMDYSPESAVKTARQVVKERAT